MRICCLGYGTVGTGLLEIIEKRNEQSTSGPILEVQKILVSNRAKHKNKDFYNLTTDNFDDILESKPETIVEVMGGLHPAFEYVSKALKSGINVVSANKDLIAEYGHSLVELAKENNVSFKFEASVAGGIPVLKPLLESLTGNDVSSIKAILNGTTNFILTKMQNENLEYEDALKIAQDVGFAEANPESDVKGYDSARKLSILSTISYKKTVYWKDFYLEGIEDVDMNKIEIAKALGLVIKLVSYSYISDDGKVYGYVRPVFVDDNSILSKVDNENNIVILQGDSVGELSFVGKGAGKLATGSAVYSDTIDIKEKRKHNLDAFLNEKASMIDFYPDRYEFVLISSAENLKELIEKYYKEEIEIVELMDNKAAHLVSNNEENAMRLLEFIRGYDEKANLMPIVK